jgi:hypothetical protein
LKRYVVTRTSGGTWVVVHGGVWIADRPTRAAARDLAKHLNRIPDRCVHVCPPEVYGFERRGR